jgi:hypothetical protein
MKAILNEIFLTSAALLFWTVALPVAAFLWPLLALCHGRERVRAKAALVISNSRLIAGGNLLASAR